MNISEAVIRRILELSQERNLSINALSVNSGITQSTVSDIVNGATYNAGIATIRKLCGGLGIEVKDFFDSPLFVGVDAEKE